MTQFLEGHIPPLIREGGGGSDYGFSACSYNFANKIDILHVLWELTANPYVLFCIEGLTSNMINIIPTISKKSTFPF